MPAKETATANTTRRRPAAQAAPALDPALLTFLEDENTTNEGHLIITATYPSRTRRGLRHRVTVRDDGSFVDCDCEGYRGKHAHCFHQAAAPEIATEYRRRELRKLSSTDLFREDSWYAHTPPDSLDAAERIVLDAIGDVVGERYIAARGRVTTPEGRTA
jgi:hypothetical protein